MPVQFRDVTTRSGKVVACHLTFVQVGHSVVWHAIARKPDGALLGTRQGRLPYASLDAPDLQERLREQVEASLAEFDQTA